MTRSSFALAVLAFALIASCNKTEKPPPQPSPTPMNPAAAPSASAEVRALPSASAANTGEIRVSFDAETSGAPSASFDGVVGEWSIGEAGGQKGLRVDGSKWRNGTPSANIADQAKRLYGDRYAEFLDGVKAFAFFPFALWQGEPPKGAIRISVRFYPLSGKIDQAAGVVFGAAPDGSYYGVRANALEDNILYFKVTKGKRNVIDVVLDVSTPSKTWHTLVVDLADKDLRVALDGQKRFEKKLDTAPSGRIGIWSKADSEVLFDDFSVTPLGAGAP